MDKEYTNSQICTLIDEHIHNQRDRNILKSRYVDGLTYDALGMKYDLSTQRVKAIVYKAQSKLIRFL